jgi:hypothetical protein
MNKLIVSACFSALIFAVPASAYSPADQSTAPSVAKQTEAKVLLLARHGKDDPAGDDRVGKRGKGGRDNDNGPNHAENQTQGKLLLLARHGKDDPAGDDRGGRRDGKGRGGNDDGPNHA